MTVTPVLADQLEAEGVGERLLDVPAATSGSAPARPTSPTWSEPLPRRLPGRGGALPRGARAARGARRRPARGCSPSPRAEGRVELLASAATHAVLPLVATRAGRRLQVDAGLRSHRRRFGEPGRVLAARVRLRAGAGAAARRARARLLLHRPERAEEPLAALAPVATAGRAGRVHDRLGGGPVAVVAATATPRTPRSPTSIASRCAARGPGRSAASPTTPAAAAARAREQAASSPPPRRRGSSASRPSAGAAG